MLGRWSVKVLGEILGAAAAATAGIFSAGASEAMPLTVTAIGAVLGFATLLVRSVLSSQRIYVEIVAAKDRELAERDDTIHYLRWEAERLRYRYGEREVDPGPYVARGRQIPRPPSSEGAPA